MLAIDDIMPYLLKTSLQRTFTVFYVISFRFKGGPFYIYVFSLNSYWCCSGDTTVGLRPTFPQWN
jgi:hypothetical protein